MDEIVFQPDPDVVESSNLISFMRAHGLPSYQDLRERSVENPGWYWDAVIRHFDIQFYKPYSAIMDGSEGKAWTRWCVGGITNIVLNCLDCRTDDERETIVWEGESGEIRSWTLGELKAEVGLLAEGLRSLGLGAGDRVGLFMPMLPETVAAFFAIAKIGGIVVPLFSGFGPEALQSRLNDSGAAAIVTVDGTRRRGKMVSLKETADAAAVAVASVEHVIVLRNLGLDVAWESARDHWWHEPDGRTNRDLAYGTIGGGCAASSWLHLGDNGETEGLRPYPLRLPYQNGLRFRPLHGPQGRRPIPLVLRHGVAHRTDHGRRQRLPRWYLDHGRRCAGLSGARSPVAPHRGSSGQLFGRLSLPGPRHDASRTRHGPSVFIFRPADYGFRAASPGRPMPGCGSSRTSADDGSRFSTTAAVPRWRGRSSRRRSSIP